MVKDSTGEEATIETLGGAKLHGEKSGVSHFVLENEDECYKKLRQLITYIPSNNREKPKRIETE